MYESLRTILRPLGVQDQAFMSDFYRHPEHVRYLPQLEVPVHQLLENRERHWATHGVGTFLVAMKNTKVPIGFCGVEYANREGMPDIRFGFIHEAWGQGYAKEVARFVL